MNRIQPVLALVLPCYNEEEVLPYTLDTVNALLLKLKLNGKVSEQSFAMYVDDGSTDNTWTLIERFASIHSDCSGLKLAGNAGHQNALLAGMLEAAPYVDCIVSMDADLQDDIFTIDKMLLCYSDGCDIVYGVRDDRTSDSVFKRVTARLYYAMMLWLGVKLVPQHGDFRLVGRNVLASLEQYNEKNIFLRGIFPSMGFKHGKVFYARRSRTLGVTKYPVSKMLSFAWQGITSFSSKPLRWVSMAGAVTMFFSLIYGLYTLHAHFTGKTIPGWATLSAGIFFLGAVQLLSVAVLGEYIAKIYFEVKARPRYIKEKVAGKLPDQTMNETQQFMQGTKI